MKLVISLLLFAGLSLAQKIDYTQLKACPNSGETYVTQAGAVVCLPNGSGGGEVTQPGTGITKTGVVIAVDQTLVPLYATGSGAPASGSGCQLGKFYFRTSDASLWYGTNSGACERVGKDSEVTSGLAGKQSTLPTGDSTTYLDGTLIQRSFTTSARAALSAGTGISYNSSIGQFSTDSTITPRYFTGFGPPTGACTSGRDYYIDGTNNNFYFCSGSSYRQVAASGISAGAGITVNGSTVAIDTTVVPQYTSGTGTPGSGSGCATGKFYFRTSDSSLWVGASNNTCVRQTSQAESDSGLATKQNALPVGDSTTYLRGDFTQQPFVSTVRGSLSAGSGLGYNSGVFSWTPDPGAGITCVGAACSTDSGVVPRYFVGTGAPNGNCTAGRDYYTSTAGNVYFCTATNTWSAPVVLSALPASGVLKVSSGALEAVSGTGSHCVHVDGTSAACSAGGDVTGAGTSVLNQIPRYSDTSGKALTPSTVSVDNAGKAVIPGGVDTGDGTTAGAVVLCPPGSNNCIAWSAPGSRATSGTIYLNLPSNDPNGSILNCSALSGGVSTCTWDAPNNHTHSAYVTGPGSATDNAIARFDSTSGKLVQNSTATVDDAGKATFPGGVESGDGTLSGRIKLPEVSANGSNYIELRSPNSRSTDLILLYPTADPTNGQVLTWSAPSSGVSTGTWASPGGNDLSPTGTVNFSGASVTRPNKTGTWANLPATCTLGDTYRASDITSGHSLMECVTTNVWKPINSAEILGNDGTTGTTQYRLAKLAGAPSLAIVAATTDTSGIIGITVSGSATSGAALIAQGGEAPCEFDNATTAGNYVQISSTTAGKCHDSGATLPTSGGQIIGRVLTTNGSSGTYIIRVFSSEVSAGGGGVTANGNPGYLCYNGSQLVGAKAVMCVNEEFMGGGASNGNIGQLGWQTATYGSCTNNFALQTATGDEYGILRIGCSTSNANQGAVVYLAKWGTMTNRTNWRIAFGFTLAATGGNRMRLGLTANTSGPAPANFLGIVADDDSSWDTSGSGVGNFKFAICNNSTSIADCDVYNTGVAQDTNPHSFALSSTTSGTYVMVLDSTTKTFCASGCDVTTSHVPTTSTEFWPSWNMASQASASKSVYANYFTGYATITR